MEKEEMDEENIKLEKDLSEDDSKFGFYQMKEINMLEQIDQNYQHIEKHKIEDDNNDKTPKTSFLCTDASMCGCGKTFSSASSLKHHLIILTGVKQFSCDICNQSFSILQYLKKHRKIHDESSKVYQCHRCSEAFRTKQLLYRHEMKFHFDFLTEEEKTCRIKQTYVSGVYNRKPKHFQCDECGKSFKAAGLFNIHKKKHLGIAEYVCDQCPKAYFEKGDLTKHMRIHTDLLLFQCQECGKSFKTKTYLDRHLKTHSKSSKQKERKYSCEECGKMFLEKGSLSQHMFGHSGVKPFVCRYCGKAFPRKGNLKVHERLHTKERPFKCSECGKEFNEQNQLKVHIEKIHHMEYKPVKTICDPEINNGHIDKSSKNNNSYGNSPTDLNNIDMGHEDDYREDGDEGSLEHEKHIILNREKSYLSGQTEFKSESGVDSNNYMGHIDPEHFSNTKLNNFYTTDNENSNSMDFDEMGSIGKSIKGSENLQDLKNLEYKQEIVNVEAIVKIEENFEDIQIKLEVNDEADVLNVNDELPKLDFSDTLEQTKRLKRRKSKQNKKLYPCQECNKQFKFKKNLLSHIDVIHKGLRPFPCDQCNKYFTAKASLLYHKKTHTGEKPFICEDCGKSFIQPGDLKTHKVLHTGDKKFQCNQCGETFSTSQYLKKHLKRHVTSKTHICEICGEAFKVKDYLNKHMNLRHNKDSDAVEKAERPICEDGDCGCGKSFSSKEGLKKHKLLIHGTDNFECDECDKQFPTASYLQKHKKMHNPSEKCDQCDKCFGNKQSLDRHKTRKHSHIWQCSL